MRWTRGGLAALVAVSVAVSLAAPAAEAQKSRFKEVEAAVAGGISRGVYPGAVVIVGRRDSILYARGFGRLTWSAKSARPHPDSTIWDIASITKVMGTTAAMLRLVDKGRVDLDAPVARYLPRFAGNGRDRVTVRMLLDHTAGFRSYVPFYRRSKTRQDAIALLYAESPLREPGDAAEYSDLNAIFAGLVIEAVTGLPLDQAVNREVMAPLRLTRTRYRVPASWLPRTAPTARERGRLRRGHVHDLNAARLGGAAGHAGLFSSGRDLARFAQAWLREGAGPGTTRWVDSVTIREFLTPNTASGSRLLGWDTPERNPDEPSVFGTLISDAAYGHTGWTGTELWIDPAHDLFLVFLTNRTFEPRLRQTRSLEKIRLVRAELSDAALRLVPRACAQGLTEVCGQATR